MSDKIRAFLQQALDEVKILDDKKTYAEQEYQLCYRAIGLLGEALGHVNCARPESPSVLMTRWTAEVKALVEQYEPARLEGLREQWVLR